VGVCLAGYRRAKGHWRLANLKRNPPASRTSSRVFAFVSAPINTAHLPPPNPTPAVLSSTGSVPKEEPRLQRVSKATQRCNRSSKPPTSRTCSSRVSADTKANSFPSLPLHPPLPVLSEGEHVPFPEHIPCFGPHNFPTLANAHARSPPHFHTHAMPPSIVRRMDRGHVLLSDGWVARAPAPI